MVKITRTAPSTALLMALVSLLLAACEPTPKNYREYKNKETSYYKGDSCEERYQLYDDGTYERYIYGVYMGKELKSRMHGTLFETGTYVEIGKPEETESDGGEDEKDEKEDGVSDATWAITFTSLKQYDFDEESLVNLGTEREIRGGTISESELTVNYRVWYEDFPDYDIGHYESATWTYTRN